MNTSSNTPKNTEKKVDKIEELKTDTPMSEKDEVKAAEERTAKINKKASQTGKNKAQ